MLFWSLFFKEQGNRTSYPRGRIWNISLNLLLQAEKNKMGLRYRRRKRKFLSQKAMLKIYRQKRGSKMKIPAVIMDTCEIKKILKHLVKTNKASHDNSRDFFGKTREILFDFLKISYQYSYQFNRFPDFTR